MSTPFEFCKVRLQVDRLCRHAASAVGPPPQPLYRGALHCAYTIARTRGIFALYDGHVINTVRECGFQAVYFGLYFPLLSAVLRRTNSETHAARRSLATFVCGGLAGCIAWVRRTCGSS